MQTPPYMMADPHDAARLLGRLLGMAGRRGLLPIRDATDISTSIRRRTLDHLLARGAELPAAATLTVGLAACGAAAAAIYAAPAPMRPPCIRWSLGYLPFTKLGTAGRLLQFVLKRLDRNPRAPANAAKTGSSQ